MMMNQVDSSSFDNDKDDDKKPKGGEKMSWVIHVFAS